MLMIPHIVWCLFRQFWFSLRCASLIVDLLLGQSNAFARFSFGFLMVAMLKIGYETTYEAIEIPSLRVLFRTLDLRFQSAIKSRIEGTFRMVALIVAGALLSLLLLLNLGRSLFINLTILILTADLASDRIYSGQRISECLARNHPPT